MNRIIEVAALGVLLAGCGGDVSIDDAPQELAKAICSYGLRCCDDAELTENFGSASANDCVAAFRMQFDEGFAELKRSVDSGRIAYDADQVGDCLDTIESAACGSPILDTDVCEAATRGLQEVGEPCEDSDECVSKFCGDGVCEALLAEGDPCGTSVETDCARDLYCSDGAEPTCKRIPDVGEACESRCHESNCVSGVCRPDPPSSSCNGR